jgi:alpha-beta hydrolase superfamily lysophospholipase
VWAPEKGTPKAIIQLSHGMCEYVQRYDAWARRFVSRGYVFCGNDHLGHGHTAPDEDELGYTAPRGGADFLVEDTHTLTCLMRAEYPNVPFVLYGHSMGSFVARMYLTRYGEELAGALISGTAGPGQPTGVALRLARMIGRTKGLHHRSRLLTGLAFGAYNKKFEGENDALSWLTSERDVRERYRHDPFCRFLFTAAGYDTLFTLLGTVSDKKWAHGVPKALPVLLFAGDMDPVGNYGRGVRAVHERLLEAGCNARLLLYPGGRHEMHNESNRDQVFEDLIAYLEEILV